MKSKSLINTNPYLKDPKKREELITRSVRTSTGVEGIKINIRSHTKAIEIPRNKKKKIYDRVKQAAGESNN